MENAKPARIVIADGFRSHYSSSVRHDITDSIFLGYVHGIL